MSNTDFVFLTMSRQATHMIQGALNSTLIHYSAHVYNYICVGFCVKNYYFILYNAEKLHHDIILRIHHLLF